MTGVGLITVSRRTLVLGALAVIVISALVSWGISASVVAGAKVSPSVATSAPDNTLNSGRLVPRYVYASESGIVPGSTLGYEFGSLETVPSGPAVVGFTITISLQVGATVRCTLFDSASNAELVTSGFQLAPAFTPTKFSAATTTVLPTGSKLVLRCAPGAGAFTALYKNQSIVVLSFSL